VLGGLNCAMVWHTSLTTSRCAISSRSMGSPVRRSAWCARRHSASRESTCLVRRPQKRTWCAWQYAISAAQGLVAMVEQVHQAVLACGLHWGQYPRQ
jgi:hypothetical protein